LVDQSTQQGETPPEADQARTYLVRFVSPTAKALSEARGTVAEFIVGALSADACDDVLLALDEIVTNALAHGASGRSIEIHVARDGGQVAVTVRDSGQGFDPRCIPCDCPDTTAEGGRGLYLAIRLMDSLTVYSGSGTIVHMSRAGGDRDEFCAPIRTYASHCLAHFVHPRVLVTLG
jgi:anti-sigma regulatory factor (Ser/Thr protein kinase)